MELKAGSKQTEVGVIPEDWDCLSIRQLIDLLTDYDANGSFESVATNVNVYDFENFAWYVRSTDLENKSSLNQVKYVDERSYKFLKKTSLYGGELLFLKRGDIGNVYLFEMRTERATLAPNLYLLKLNNTSIPKYLYYYFTSDSGQRQLKSKNASSTLGALYKDDVKSIIVPLPPLPEQTAIATALSDMDALIAQTEKLIEKKKAIKQGVMQELLKPYGLDGKMKEGWVVRKLGEVADIYTGKRNNQDKKEDGEYPFFVRSQTIERIDSYSFDGEAILVPGEGNIGNIFHYINGKFDFHQRVYKISDFSNEVYPKYLFLYLKEHFGKHALSNTVKATVDSLRLPTFMDFELPYPSDKSVQIEIANSLFDIDKEIERIETKLQKLKHQKQGMMQALLTGKIRLI